MRKTYALSLLLLLAACDVGSGSRVPPFLPRMTPNILSGVVHDQDGKAVIGALVRIAGTSATAATARNGRFLFENPPTGTRLLTVDGTAAAADGTDRFATLTVLVTISSGPSELPRTLVLPDLAAGTSATLALGAQGVATTIDGSATSGAILEIQAGTLLSRAGATVGNVQIDLARVDREDLPLPLPPDVVGARLPTRGIWITPLDLSFSAGVTLSLPNDLAAAVSALATLFRFDPAQGLWVAAGTGTVQTGGTRIRSNTSDIAGGGLYVFATTITQTKLLTGRVVDADQLPVPGASVTAAGAASVRTDANGQFTVGPVAAVDGANQPLALPAVVVPGIGFAPVPFAGAVPAGDLTIDTVRTGLLRFVVVQRGRAERLRRVEIGGPDGVGALRLSGSDGLGRFQEVPFGWSGATVSWVEDKLFFRGLAREELRAGNAAVDLQLLVRDESPAGAIGGRLFAVALDARFGAPIQDVVVQGRNDAKTADNEKTNEFGEVFVNADRFGDTTAAFASEQSGTTVKSAVTLGGIDNSRAEFPIRLARRSQLGVFDEHGLVTGNLTSTGAGTKVRRVLVRPTYRENDFWHRALTGDTFAGQLPRRLDPEVAGGTSFTLGVPVVSATLTGLEGQNVGALYVPERVGIARDLTPASGVSLSRDVALGHTWNRTVTIERFVSILDPALAGVPIRYECGALLADGRAVDLLQGGGGVTASSGNAVVPVPDRTGDFAGATWLLGVTAEGPKGGATIAQSTYVRTQDATIDPGTFLAPPVITSPAPGSTTASASTVDVNWTVPVGADFLVLELSSTSGSDTRHWRVVLGVTRTTFRFQELVEDAPDILAAGRTWNLTLTAFQVSRGLAFQENDGYQRILGNLFSLRPGERGIGASASYELTFATP